MAAGTVTVIVEPRPEAQLLVPAGLSTPHALCTGVVIYGLRDGARVQLPWGPTEEANTGQPAYLAACGDDPVEVAGISADDMVEQA